MVLSGVGTKASMILLGERTVKKRGIIPTAVSGVGVDLSLKTFDNFLGSPAQRFVSFNAPFIGPVGVLDAINFLIFSRGGKDIKGGLTAVIGAKVVTGGILSTGGLNLGSLGVNLSGQGSAVASGAQGASV